MKKLCAILTASLMALSLAACGSSASAPASSAAESTASSSEATAESTAEATGAVADASGDPAVTLVYAEVNPLDTIVGKTDSAFKEKVEELSGGSITIDLQASGVLGSENDVLDSMLGGDTSIQMSRISAFALNSYGATKSKLLSIPYTFVSRDHYWNFVNSDLAQDFLNESTEAGLGVRGLFYGEEGFRSFFSVKPVNGMDELKGMKIRVSNDPIMTGMVTGLGANPTVVSMKELYSALQTGVVDAAEQPVVNYKSNAFPEVANNLILDEHTLGAIEVIISQAAWDSLTEAQQQCVTEAAKYASDYNRTVSEETEAATLKELKDAGCNIVEVADKAPWQEACAGLIAEQTKGQEDLYKQIVDMQ